MTDYIEREAVLEIVNNLDDKTALVVGRKVVNLPVADVVQVRHGKWVSLTDCSNAGVYCSVCQKKVWEEDYAWCNKQNKVRSPYCPNCGAKMEEEGRNE